MTAFDVFTVNCQESGHVYVTVSLSSFSTFVFSAFQTAANPKVTKLVSAACQVMSV